ncbi:unnamed protein product, partial [Mesorhabditis spiculigera]
MCFQAVRIYVRHCSDWHSVKGYSDFSTTIYPHTREYIWLPLRKMNKIGAMFIIGGLVFMVVEFERVSRLCLRFMIRAQHPLRGLRDPRRLRPFLHTGRDATTDYGIDRFKVYRPEVVSLFALLYHIEEVDMALHFHRMAGVPIDANMLQHVARKATNVELTEHVADVVITLFDENMDGKLSNREFVAVMRRRMRRGLEHPRDTGVFRLAEAVLECSRRAWSNCDTPTSLDFDLTTSAILMAF